MPPCEKKTDVCRTVMNYGTEDFDLYLLFQEEAERLEPSGRLLSREALTRSLARPGYDPHKDLFLARTPDRIVGYLDITAELEIGRVLLEGLVHPYYRRQGIATELCAKALRRAGELGARRGHVSVPDANLPARRFLSSRGFQWVRRFLELRLVLYHSRLPSVEDRGVTIRKLRAGEEGRLAGIQNRAFEGSWGYHPNTVEEIVYRLGLNDCRHEDVMLGWEADAPLGYCWTTVTPVGHNATQTRTGRIHMMGVDPSCRSRGLGRTMLLAGLRHLRDKGIQVVDLTVDAENTSACILYASVGFKKRSATLWYEKAVG